MDFHEKKYVKNPRATANPVSRLFFWWVFPLFRVGGKRELDIDDLYNVLEEDESGKLGDRLQKAWEEEYEKAKKQNKRPRFYKALLKVFLTPYAIVGFAFMIDEWIIRVAQTLFLRELIRSFSEGADEQDKYIYGTGIIVTTFVHTITLHPSVFRLQHVGMKCRVAACSVIYRKALRLSKAAQGQTTVGQLVNLLSNDVNRFDTNVLFLHWLYIAPVQGCIFMYFLWTTAELGPACLAGAGFILILVPIMYYIGKLFTIYRFQIAKKTDRRSQIMNEIVIAMRVIKMYAWEKPFSALVNELRRLEVKVLRKTALLRAFYLSLFISASKLITYFTILAFILTGGELKAETVFFMVPIYTVMRQVIVSFIPTAAAHIGELIVSMNRIEDFLLLDEKKATDSLQVFTPFLTSDPKHEKRQTVMDPSIVMNKVTASWTGGKPTLKEITVNLRGDKLIMVVGPVGCGKTSFLHALISELPITAGKCVVTGQSSYSSQEAWIFSGNLRQNVLFGRPYDEGRYKAVIRASALEEDLVQLPFGENTIVGERGVALSGGQKARVNLARALYQDADIYLMDDPLSAVDSRVSRYIFDKVGRQFLKGKLRVLVTHQLQYLPQADHIIVLNAGEVVAQGTYQQLMDQNIDFVSLLASETEEDSKKGNAEAKENQGAVEVGSTEVPVAATEQMAGGSVTAKTYWDYFKSGNSYFGITMLALGFIFSQTLYSIADYWLSYWTTAAERGKCTEEEAEWGTESTTEEFWSSSFGPNNATETPCEEFDNSYHFYVYTGLIVAIFVITKVRAIYFFHYCMNISINVHDNMFSSMARAPTKFFDDNPSGRIMNRFTKDIGSMDELLPAAFFDALSIFLLMGGTIIIVIITNYYVIIPAILLLTSLVLIRRFYIQTARHVKRIEAVTRSPVFTHLAATVQGLTTIRALGAQDILVEQFDGHQDLHSSSWYIFISANRWFGIWLEMLSLIFLICVTYGFMLLASLQSFNSGTVGLAISSCLGLTGTFQWGMRQSAETENLMTSVERALEYSKLESEAPLESKPEKKPPKTWPTEGEIKFRHLSLAYEDKDVLKDLTFDIKGREKIGIVGRTGAGKSSIIAALFRMTEPRGEVYIDNVKITDIGLHDVRGNISIIPQDPVLFSGTIRYNLDPFSQFQDDELWTVIEEVELKEAVPDLDFEVADGGSNFSVGQRQLVCLARAILRKNKIIVMDEATANVDPRTDNFIQTTIRTKFADCSIITIAHRLHSVMDCDRILVLDNGYLKEYDHPHALLKDPSSILSSMVEHTGAASSRILRQVAKETYSGRRMSFQADNVSLLSSALSTAEDVILSSSTESDEEIETNIQHDSSHTPFPKDPSMP